MIFRMVLMKMGLNWETIKKNEKMKRIDWRLLKTGKYTESKILFLVYL